MPESKGLLTIKADCQVYWAPSTSSSPVLKDGVPVRKASGQSMKYYDVQQSTGQTWACINGRNFMVLDAVTGGEYQQWFPDQWVLIEEIEADETTFEYGDLEEGAMTYKPLPESQIVAIDDVNLRTEPHIKPETLITSRNKALRGEVFTKIGEVVGHIHRGIDLWHVLKDADHDEFYGHSLYFRPVAPPKPAQTKILLGAQVAEPWWYDKSHDANWRHHPHAIINKIKALKPDAFLFITERYGRIGKAEVNLIRSISPDARLIARPLVAWPRDEHKLTIDQIADQMSRGYEPLYKEGVYLTQVFNEPQFKHEGFDIQWRSPREFADTWLAVCDRLRPRFPGTTFSFPAIGNDPYLKRWMDETLYASQTADRVDIHIYPVNPPLQHLVLAQVKLICDTVLAANPNIEFDITEIAVPDQRRHPDPAAALILDTLDKISAMGYPIRSAHLYTIYINDAADYFGNSILHTNMAEILGRR